MDTDLTAIERSGRRAAAAALAALIMIPMAALADDPAAVGVACDASQPGRTCVATEGGHVLLAGFLAEVGIEPFGTFGTRYSGGANPNVLTLSILESYGFRPQPVVLADGQVDDRGLGLIADRNRDGLWEDIVGDFFVPGEPFEGWGIQVDSTRAHNHDYMDAPLTVPGAFVPGSLRDGSGGGTHEVQWESTGTFEGIRIRKKFQLPDGAQLVHVDVELINEGATRVEKLFYSRSIDPDEANAADVDPEFAVRVGLPPETSFAEESGLAPFNYANDPFTSLNRIVSNPDGSTTLAQLTAEFPGGASFSLLARDPRARGWVQSAGDLFTSAPVSGREANYYINQEALWNGDEDAVFTSEAGFERYADAAMHLLFDLGPLEPGGSTEFRFTYVLSDFDLQFARAGTVPPDPRGSESPVIEEEVEEEVEAPPLAEVPTERAFLPGPDGRPPSLPAGSAVWQLADGTVVPLVVSTGGPDRLRYEAEGLTLTFTGAQGTSVTAGLVADVDGEIECEVCTMLVPGRGIDVWLFSTPRLIGAHLVGDMLCQRFIVPFASPLDGLGPVGAGAHTLQLTLPTPDGPQAINVGLTVGGPVPAEVPSGEGPLPSSWLVAVLLLVAGPALVIGRRALVDA